MKAKYGISTSKIATFKDILIKCNNKKKLVKMKAKYGIS